MYKNILWLILLLLPSSSWAIESIRFVAKDKINSALLFNAPFKPNIEEYLELGDTLSTANIIVAAATAKNLRISLQLETSMSITADGAHLDLNDWKHCTTAWLPVTELPSLTFTLPDFDTINTDCFPAVTTAEIKTEVFKQGGQEWVDVLEEKGLPKDYQPVLITLSVIRIRIEQRIDSSWQPLTVIQLAVPMGC